MSELSGKVTQIAEFSCTVMNYVDRSKATLLFNTVFASTFKGVEGRGGGGGVEVGYRLLRQIKVLLFITGEPQSQNRQKYKSLKVVFLKSL